MRSTSRRPCWRSAPSPPRFRRSWCGSHRGDSSNQSSLRTQGPITTGFRGYAGCCSGLLRK
jgi:hypothetical protein